MGESNSLAGHSFTASKDMKSFYVIDDGLAQIVCTTPINTGSENNGLSLELVTMDDGTLGVKVSAGNAFASRMPEMIRLGSLQVEEHSYNNGEARHEVTAFFSGAYIKNAQRVFTVGGIGITDIISADPLKVVLINAPLDEMAMRGGGKRFVMGVLIDVQEVPNEEGVLPNLIWNISVALNGLELRR